MRWTAPTRFVGHEQRSVPILLDVDRAAEIMAVVISASGEDD
jgi:hypothetical protein